MPTTAVKNKPEPVDTLETNADDLHELVCDVSSSVKKYADKHPAVLGSVLVFAGFYLGWKLRPW